MMMAKMKMKKRILLITLPCCYYYDYHLHRFRFAAMVTVCIMSIWRGVVTHISLLAAVVAVVAASVY